MSVLARGDTAGGKTAAVADAVDVVDGRHFGIAGQQEIGVHGVRRAGFLHRADGGDESLTNYLAAEDPLPADLGAAAAKQVHFQRLKVEDGQKIVDGRGHGRQRLGRGSKGRLNLLCSGKIYKEAS